MLSGEPECRPWPADPRYLAYDDGTVLGPRGPVGTIDRNTGYRIVTIRTSTGRTSTGAHSIVCAAWHGPRPNGMQAAHYNGIRTDNRPSNLRWATPAGNAADRLRHGTGTLLTAADVYEIRASDEVSRDELACRFGVTPGTISHIRLRRTWRGLPEIDPTFMTGHSLAA